MAGTRVRFVASKSFDAIVMTEASGSAGAGMNRRGRPIRDARGQFVSLSDIAEQVADKAVELSSEASVTPRSAGGLRGSRHAAGRTYPRPGYDFRRERTGQRQYQSSFTDPQVGKGGAVKVAVFNLSPAAQMVEDGTGKEGQPLRAKGGRVYRLPITQAAYKRMYAYSKKNYTLATRVQRGVLSGDKDYRRDAAAHYRAVSNGKKATGHYGGVRRDLDKERERRAGAAKARAASSKPGAGALHKQLKGYSRAFLRMSSDGTVSRSRVYKIKRKGYLVSNGGKAYLGTPDASRYAGYGILRRALIEVSSRYQ